MTYEKAVAYLLELPRFTKKNGLKHTKQFMERLGNPQEAFHVVHVAGSNGKGSVSSFLAGVLEESGRVCGLFTSPHLVDIRERFRINGTICSKEMFLDAVRLVLLTISDMQEDGLAHPTFFECMFAISMVMFQRAGVEIAVLETGLGGRLDATNTVRKPLLTVITSISLEHTEYLGDTIGKIAAEKAGIIKKGVPVVFDGGNKEAAGVILTTAKAKGAPAFGVYPENIKILLNTGKNIDFRLYCGYDNTDVTIPSGAAYQARNGAVALRAVRLLQETLSIGESAVRKGFANTKWPGRMEELLPNIYVDGAHNPDGIRAFLEAVKELAGVPAILLFSMMKGKDCEGAAELICKSECFEEIVLTSVPDNPRTWEADMLAAVFRKKVGEHVKVLCIEKPDEALSRGMADLRPNQKLFCAGSLYLVGELKKMTGGVGND